MGAENAISPKLIFSFLCGDAVLRKSMKSALRFQSSHSPRGARRYSFCRVRPLHLDSCRAPRRHSCSCDTPPRAYLSEAAWKIELAWPCHSLKTMTTLCECIITENDGAAATAEGPWHSWRGRIKKSAALYLLLSVSDCMCVCVSEAHLGQFLSLLSPHHPVVSGISLKHSGRTTSSQKHVTC